MKAIEEHGTGVVLYLRKAHEGFLASELSSSKTRYPKQASIMRGYGIGAQILRDIGVKKIKLLSNHKKELKGLDTFGLEILEEVPFDILKREEQS